MLEWPELVSVSGGNGHIHGFHVIFHLPDINSNLDPTPNQKFAVELFYGRKFEGMNEAQAHVMLCVREFSRISFKKIFKKKHSNMSKEITLCLAAFLLNDKKFWTFCQKWGENAFARGSASPSVEGTPIYEDLRQFGEYVDGSIFMITS